MLQIPADGKLLWTNRTQIQSLPVTIGKPFERQITLERQEPYAWVS